MAGDALWLLSWNLRNSLVPPNRSSRDTLWPRRGPAACTDKEHLITGMLPQEGGFAIMLQETGIATRAQEMHVAAALRDKGYTAFFSSRLAETGATSTSRGGGLLTTVSSKYVAEHEVLSFTEIVPGKAAALEIRTDGEASPSSTSTGCKQAAPRGRDGRRSGPTYKCMPRHAALVGGTRWSSPATPTSTWMYPPTRPRSTSERAGRPAVSEGPRQAARRT